MQAPSEGRVSLHRAAAPEIEIGADGDAREGVPPGGYRTARTGRAPNLLPQGSTLSSFSKQPLAGSTPPSNLAVTLVIQSLAFGFAGLPGVPANCSHEQPGTRLGHALRLARQALCLLRGRRNARREHQPRQQHGHDRAIRHGPSIVQRSLMPDAGFGMEKSWIVRPGLPCGSKRPTGPRARRRVTPPCKGSGSRD